MPRMRNVNVYVDVDLTLIDHQGGLLPDAGAAMRALYDAGCHLFLWSTGGGRFGRAGGWAAGTCSRAAHGSATIH